MKNKEIYNLEKLITEIKKLIESGASSQEIVTEYEPKVLEMNTPYLSYWFKKTFPDADTKAHGNVILEGSNLFYDVVYAVEIKGADIKAHEAKILSARVPWISLMYVTLCIENGIEANVKAHEAITLEAKDARMSLDWIKCVPEADVKAHDQIIIEAKNPHLSFEVLLLNDPRTDKASHQAIYDSYSEEDRLRDLERKKELKHLLDMWPNS